MRILNLVPGAAALADSSRLVAEIRSFNAEIDFRLRFLHVEIDPFYAAPPDVVEKLETEIDPQLISTVPAVDPLYAAALLTQILSRERPDLLVIPGRGELLDPALAAARACGTKIAVFGGDRPQLDDALDLGDDPAAAIDLLTGVAREIN